MGNGRNDGQRGGEMTELEFLERARPYVPLMLLFIGMWFAALFVTSDPNASNSGGCTKISSGIGNCRQPVG